MVKWMDFGAAAFAVLAAIFWFLSASGKLPPMVAYWDRAPEGDPFYQAIIFSAVMDKWAAGFSGAAALCMAVKLIMTNKNSWVARLRGP